MIRRKRVDISHANGGGMEDVNEQELAKSTDEQQFFGESDADGDSAEEPSSSASACEEAVADKQEKPPEEIKLPVSVPEPSEIVEIPAPEEESIPDADSSEEEIPDEEENDSEENQPPDEDEPLPRRRGGSGRIYVAIIAICLVLSLILSVLSFMDRSQEPPETEAGETVTDTEETAPMTDNNAEALSAIGIYQARKKTSVTVTATTSEGKIYLSGTAVLGSGHIATVYSGVANADRVEVTLSDGKTYAATVIGGDATVDLALLKTDAVGLEYVELSETASFEAGKRVYAIGTAEEAQFGGSLFEGVVSFGERSLELSDTDGEFRRATAVQIGGFGDRALCGSPVFDEYGAAVAMVWNGGDDTSVALALPLDRVITVLEFFKNGEIPTAQALKTIAYTAPSLGIVGQNGSVGEVYGVVISDFSTPSCDAAVQLRKGDLIFKIGETVTADTVAVKQAIWAFAPGDKVEVHVIRDDQQLSYFIELM